MNKTIAAVIALSLVALIPLGGATHPESEGLCKEHNQYVPSDSETTSYPVYVTIDEVMSNDYIFSIWIYAESNGVDGIQRDDDYCYTEGYDTSSSDTIIF